MWVIRIGWSGYKGLGYRGKFLRISELKIFNIWFLNNSLIGYKLNLLNLF